MISFPLSFITSCFRRVVFGVFPRFAVLKLSVQPNHFPIFYSILFGIFAALLVFQKSNKTLAEQRDIFRPKLFYNYINSRLKRRQCTMKKSLKKKALIQLSPFLNRVGMSKIRMFLTYVFTMFLTLINISFKNIFLTQFKN